MQLSIVVPLYNEEESIRPLCEAIVAAVTPLGVPYEVILVDDGSRDSSFERAAQIARDDPRIRVLRFRRNAGQTPAMAAGIQYARGEVIVTMDGDLQNDPADIGAFLQEIRNGYDLVVGWRFNRQDKLVSRKIPSRIANWLIGRITGVPIKDNGCSLKAYRADVIKRVPLYSELHRFIPAMSSITGARIKEIKVRHHARKFGQSKYGLSRIFKVLSDLLTVKTLTSFASRPLLWFALLATVPTLLGCGLVLAAVYNAASTGMSPVILTGTGLLLLALGGFLVLTGVLCELVHDTGNLEIERMSLLTARGVRRRRN